MSQTLDERIVSMEFDNERFEKNIDETMKSLDNLDRQIDEASGDISGSFDNMSHGFLDLEEIIRGFNYKVGGYLADVAKKAVDFAKSMSFDQIKAGFDKYTAETLSAQTIVSNAGQKIAETYGLINESGDIDEPAVIEETYKALQKLQKYTDETSYSYANLSDTMSKFIMNGTDMYDAEQAMEGIGNWAAVTGAGIQKASAIMPYLVKSINAGYLRLRDWQGIQANNMADPVFVEKLLENTRKLSDEFVAFEKKNGRVTFDTFTDEKNGVFGNNKLITAEALVATLKEYGDATEGIGKKGKAAAAEAKTLAEAIDAVKDAVSTGWDISFRYLFGNYAEARQFFTMIQDMMLDVFTLGINFRNEVLEKWHVATYGGYKDLVSALGELWDAIKEFATPIGKAFHEIFGFNDSTATAQSLINITKRFKAFTHQVYDFAKRPQDLELIFNAIKNGSASDIPEELLERYSGVINSLTDSNFDVMSKLFINEDKKAELEKILDDIKNTFGGLFSVIKTGLDFVKGFGSALGSVLSNASRLAKPILSLTGGIGSFVKSVQSALSESKLISKLWNSLADIVNAILSPAIEFLSWIFESLGKTFNNLSDNASLYNLFVSLGDAVQNLSKWITGKLKDAFDWLKDAGGKIVEKFKPLEKSFESIGEKVKELFGSLSNTEANASKITIFDKIGSAIGSIAEWLLNNAFLPALDGFVSLIDALLKAAEPLQPILKSIGDAIGMIFTNLFKGSKGDASGESPLTKVFGVLSDIATFLVENAVVPLLEGLSSVLKDLGDNTKPLGQIFEDVGKGISNFFSGLFGSGEAQSLSAEAEIVSKNSETFNKIGQFLKDAGTVIGKIAGWLADVFHNIYENIKTEIDKLKNLKFTDILDLIKQILSTLTALFGARAVFNVGTFAGNLAGISGAINDFIQGITGAKKASSLILDVGKALLMIAASCLIVASIDPEKLKTAAETIHEFIDSLVASVVLMNSSSAYFTASLVNVKTTGISGFASNFVDMAIAIFIIAEALKRLAEADISEDKLKPALEAIEFLIAILGSFGILSGLLDKKYGLGKGPKGLLVMAASIWIISKALIGISNEANPEQLKAATYAISAIIGVLTLFVAAEGLGQRGAKVSINMRTTLAQLALVIAAFAGLMYVLGNLIEGDESLVVATACLAGLILMLIALGMATKRLELSAKNVGSLAALIIALGALAGILYILSEINIENVAYGLLEMVALFGILAALGAAATLFSDAFASVMTGLIAMYAVVGLMAAMAGVLMLLSQIDFASAITGLIALVAAFGVVVGIAVIAQLFETALLSLAVVLTGFGVALLAAGAGLYLIAEAFRIIADTVVNIVPMMTHTKDEIIGGLNNMIDVVLFAISAAVPALIAIITAFLVTLIIQLAESADEIITAVVELIFRVAESIDKNADKIGAAVASLIVAILKAVVSFLKELLYKILEWFGVSREEASAFFANAWNTITGFIADVIQAVKDWFADIGKKWNEMWNAIGEALDKLDQTISETVEGIVKSVIGFFKGLWDDIVKIWNSITSIFKKENNQTAINDARNTGKAIADGAASGVSSGSGDVAEETKKMFIAATKAGRGAVQVNSPSKVFYQIGRFIDMGAANGISDFAYLVSDAAEDMANSSVSPMQEAIDMISNIDANALGEPVIAPVLDLSNIQNGVRGLGALFGGQSIGANLSASLAGATQSSMSPFAPVFNIYGSEGQSAQDIANEVSKILNTQFKQRSNVWK